MRHGIVKVNEKDDHMCFLHFTEKVRLYDRMFVLNRLLLYTISECENEEKEGKDEQDEQEEKEEKEEKEVSHQKKKLSAFFPYSKKIEKMDQYIGNVMSFSRENAMQEDIVAVQPFAYARCISPDCRQQGVIPHSFKRTSDMSEKGWSCLEHFWSANHTMVNGIVQRVHGSLRLISKSVTGDSRAADVVDFLDLSAMLSFQNTIHRIMCVIDDESDSEDEGTAEQDERVDGEAEEGSEDEDGRPKKKRRRGKEQDTKKDGMQQSIFDFF